jgi:hypothetical protein
MAYSSLQLNSSNKKENSWVTNPTAQGARQSASLFLPFDGMTPVPLEEQPTVVHREDTHSTHTSTKADAFRDPAFIENRAAPVHRWVPWIAGFSAQFVEDVFREFLPRTIQRPLVLDPFAGVGTSLVQAMLHGYDTIGFEINPYAALATQVKLRADCLETGRLGELIQTVEQLPDTWDKQAPPKQYHPVGFRSRIPFFSERIEPQVLGLLELLHHIADPLLADVARVAFGAMMVKVSNYTYEPSLSSRPGAGKPLLVDANVPTVFAAKLREIQEDVIWMKQMLAENGSPSTRKDIYCTSFLTLQDQLSSGSVDLMVTSSPYMNNYHYVRNTRPQLFWLSFVENPRELRQLEQDNFGKFWQTVRDAETIPLQCDHRELVRIVSTIRETRVESGAYGGPGWANYVASYFNDCDRFMGILHRVLRHGGIGVVVIGNSIIQGIPIATDQILGDLAGNHGLTPERIIPLRTKRVGASITASSVRRGEKSTVRLYENAVVLRKQ